ncbi:hypothetical protein Leryth_020434 [Lithospermum erythrorhizon]|nr:hypothetical protein Leryth_020434 [Lithospermum erythrorhizon]
MEGLGEDILNYAVNKGIIDEKLTPSNADEEDKQKQRWQCEDKKVPLRLRMLSRSMIPDPHDIELWLKVDGEMRQKGSTKDMIFKIPYLISHISSFMTLLEGDVILTGTPEGVGPVKVGQKIDAGITGLLDVYFNVGKRPVTKN